MLQHPLTQAWQLESIFPGGSASEAFIQFMHEVEQKIAQFAALLQQHDQAEPEQKEAHWLALLEHMQRIGQQLHEADSFTACLAAGQQNDRRAVELSGKVKELYARYEALLTSFDQLLLQLSEESFKQMMAKPPWQQVAYSIQERRDMAKDKLSPEQESLVSALAVDGYHGWSDLYNTTVSKMVIEDEDEEGIVQLYSAGQYANKLHCADNEERARLFDHWEKAWSEKADFFAEALNHLAGFRLQLYKHRGWNTVHREPLAINRMSQQTLDVMWQTIDRNKGIFLEYFQRKADLLGLEQLSWADVEAPIAQSESTISYDDGAAMIVEQFRKFSPKMADFAEMAFNESWIEAEDRAGKRPGGFCTSFPLLGETRIFMTYSGTASNVSTLAHELGHAYHQHVMRDMAPLAQQYAMNVAETASTFAELIVSDAALKEASTKEEQLAVLEDKIQRAVAFYMNIHARFIFETNFYEERKKGLVSVERLNELMAEAQRQAFHHALGDVHPHFWAAKLHFYATDVPFYNFPYTFGFLFSAGIYAKALEEGQAFEERYVALLRDTGSMSVEELAYKHLGADLTEASFWQSGIDMTIADVKQFLEMTAQ